MVGLNADGRKLEAEGNVERDSWMLAVGYVLHLYKIQGDVRTRTVLSNVTKLVCVGKGKSIG